MRKMFFLLFLAMILVSESNAASQKQEESEYPSREIRLIVPYAPGGSTDTTARIVSKAASEYLNNQEIVIVNKPGAASTIGLTFLSQADPDGYTIGETTNTPLTIKPHTSDLAYKWDEFEPIMRMVGIPQGLVVTKDAPWDSFEEWFKWMKENPGEFKYGIAGVGVTAHLAMEDFLAKNDLKAQYVPYAGGGPVAQALLGGDVDASIGFVGNYDPSQVNYLFTFGREKTTGWGDVPTLHDAASATGTVTAGQTAYIGLLAPHGTPQEKIQILFEAYRKALNDPEVEEKLANFGLQKIIAGPEEFAEIIEEGFHTNEKILKEIGLAK